MVHFTQYCFRTLFYSDIRMSVSLLTGYPIRLSADHKICASPRSFSQLITAFFASQLHRHPPWTYISLDHIILSASYTFLRFHYALLSSTHISTRRYSSALTFILRQIISNPSLDLVLFPSLFVSKILLRTVSLSSLWTSFCEIPHD